MMELCDRRGFVASLAALGVAGAARPARGEEAPPLKISPIREGGVGEVLKVAHFEIAAGAAKPFRILHASDTHLNFWDVTDFYGNEARERHFGTRWVRFPQALTSQPEGTRLLLRARQPRVPHVGRKGACAFGGGGPRTCRDLHPQRPDRRLCRSQEAWEAVQAHC